MKENSKVDNINIKELIGMLTVPQLRAIITAIIVLISSVFSIGSYLGRLTYQIGPCDEKIDKIKKDYEQKLQVASSKINDNMLSTNQESNDSYESNKEINYLKVKITILTNLYEDTTGKSIAQGLQELEKKYRQEKKMFGINN